MIHKTGTLKRSVRKLLDGLSMSDGTNPNPTSDVEQDI